jgi:hypothetical protein
MDTHRYSVCLLYWHKRTNTDAAAQKNALLHAALRAAAVQQRLASKLECVEPGAGLSLSRTWHAWRVCARSLTLAACSEPKEVAAPSLRACRRSVSLSLSLATCGEPTGVRRGWRRCLSRLLAGLSLACARSLPLSRDVRRANWSAPRLAQVRPHALVA